MRWEVRTGAGERASLTLTLNDCLRISMQFNTSHQISRVGSGMGLDCSLHGLSPDSTSNATLLHYTALHCLSVRFYFSSLYIIHFFFLSSYPPLLFSLLHYRALSTPLIYSPFLYISNCPYAPSSSSSGSTVSCISNSWSDPR